MSAVSSSRLRRNGDHRGARGPHPAPAGSQVAHRVAEPIHPVAQSGEVDVGTVPRAQLAHGQHHQHLREQVRRAAHLEPGTFEQGADLAPRIAAVVAEFDVPRGERPLQRRNREHECRARIQTLGERGERAEIVLDVFDDVEHRHHGVGADRRCGVVACLGTEMGRQRGVEDRRQFLESVPHARNVRGHPVAEHARSGADVEHLDGVLCFRSVGDQAESHPVPERVRRRVLDVELLTFQQSGDPVRGCVAAHRSITVEGTPEVASAL